MVCSTAVPISHIMSGEPLHIALDESLPDPLPVRSQCSWQFFQSTWHSSDRRPILNATGISKMVLTCRPVDLRAVLFLDASERAFRALSRAISIRHSDGCR